ncbi:MAG: 6-phosphogluconolactonase [Candidatus Marinimicrobia bacterium]|nr:6-phosphogluconolactonase [Candidatus Neomarinimicrobiota bacterium]
MTIRTFPNISRLSRYGARLIASRLEEFAGYGGPVVLALVGGRSVSGIYTALSGRDMPAWKQTHFFWADERRVAPDDPLSNYRLAYETLLYPLLERGQISAENIHPVDTSTDPTDAAWRYTLELKAFGGRFDIALLSAGEDNHVAGIFPDRSYPEDSSFIAFNDSPKPPSERFTATPLLLSGTRCGIIVFSGAGKRPALDHFLNGATDKSPAEKVLESIGDLTLLTDQRG